MGKAARADEFSENDLIEKKYRNWFSPVPEVNPKYGPDPLLMRKTGQKKKRAGVGEYKRRLDDDQYLDHAIDKIAQELSHFLVK